MRIALFADAGYLLAGAHDVLGGTTSRSAFDCDHEQLVLALRQHVEEHSGAAANFLRTYWYDGAREGVPTPEHRAIGALPYVKVRLGRLNVRGQQKGVDGLIYRDLTTLARAGAVERAYLFTGDEDLRESVAAAQDLGVQVVLITFTPTKQTGHSAALVREVDDVIVLEKTFWEPFFTRREEPAAAAAPVTEALRPIASNFARQWAEGATTDEILRLVERAPTLPREMHVQLLQTAEKSVGSLRPHTEAKRELKALFWDELKAMTREERKAAATSDADDSASSSTADVPAAPEPARRDVPTQ